MLWLVSLSPRYLKEFRTEQCPLFVQHKCTQHRPFSCFHWHFLNQRRRRPIRRRDGTFNYSPDVYCTKYDEGTGTCPDGDEWVKLGFQFCTRLFTSCLPLSTPLHVTSSIKRKCYCCSCTELLNSHRFWNADNGDWCWHICMKYIPVVGILCLTATQWLGLNINWLITLKLNSSSESTECADHCFAKGLFCLLVERQWSSYWGYTLSSIVSQVEHLGRFVFDAYSLPVGISIWICSLWDSFRLKCAEPLCYIWQPLGKNTRNHRVGGGVTHWQREC